MTPELALAGYLPRDLLLSPGFVEPLLGRRSRRWPEALAGGPAVLVGLPEPNPSDEGRPLFNTAVLLRDGHVGPRFRKALLPTYDVFDEDRYFEPFRGPQVLEIGDRRLGISICEDVWNDRDFWKRRRYHFDPIQELVGRRRRRDREPVGVAVLGRQASPARSDARQHGRQARPARAVREPGRRQRRPRLRRPQLGVQRRGRADRARPRVRHRRRRSSISTTSTPLAPCSGPAGRSGNLGRARARHARLRPEVRLLVGRARALGRHRLRADGRDCRRGRRTRPRARRADAVAVFEPGQRRRLARAGRAASASRR